MMKLACLLFLLFFFTQLPLQAQVVFSFDGLKHVDSAVIYRGIDNKISLKNLSVDSTFSIEIKSSKGEIIEQHSRTEFIYMPRKAYSDLDTLILWINGREITRKVVSVRKMSDPEIWIAGGKFSKISKQSLLASPYLIVVYPQSQLNVYDYIARMEITAKYGGLSYFYKVQGNFFPPELIRAITIYKGKVILECDVVFYGGLRCPTRTEVIYEVF